MYIQEKVIILDFGSEYTQLIARRTRELGVYSEIHPCTISLGKLQTLQPKAIILSSGPASVSSADAPRIDPQIFDWGLPVLGIGYGMQLMAELLGGEVVFDQNHAYEASTLQIVQNCPLWNYLPLDESSTVWMPHGDHVGAVPPGFTVIAQAPKVGIAAMAHAERRLYGVQFHPEVEQTKQGDEILRNFLFQVAELQPTWTMSSFVDSLLTTLPTQVGEDKVVCGLSGGIDSTVVAVLLNKAIGRNLHCIFVDNGLLRAGEGEEVVGYLRKHFDLNLHYVQAQDKFLSRLQGVEDPEKKRKIIGHTFIDVFEAEAKKITGVKYLAQGTLYPDVIESVNIQGSTAVIKSHHNVGGLPEKMNLALIEPLRELFKDEVRKVAQELGLPDFIVWRHPFPGPGLAIRVLGEITEGRLDILRQADKIVQHELMESGWYYKVWQGFAVLLPLKTVGVMDNQRTYEHVIALRIVDSIDAMTADWTRMPSEILAKISSRIINEVKGANRVVYDISSKPPSTIEWE